MGGEMSANSCDGSAEKQAVSTHHADQIDTEVLKTTFSVEGPVGKDEVLDRTAVHV